MKRIAYITLLMFLSQFSKSQSPVTGELEDWYYKRTVINLNFDTVYKDVDTLILRADSNSVFRNTPSTSINAGDNLSWDGNTLNSSATVSVDTNNDIATKYDIFGDTISLDTLVIPSGGTTNQVLTKLSNIDHDVGWANQTASGGGGGITNTLSYIIGTTVNAPTSGDSIIQHAAIDTSYAKVYRNGKRLWVNRPNGFTLSDSTITVNPPYLNGDTIFIELVSESLYSSISLRDTGTSPPSGDNLIAHYKMEQDSTDETSNNYHFTRVGSPTYNNDILDMDGYHLWCGGSNNAAVIPHTIDFGNTFTITSWVSLATAITDHTIIDALSGNDGFRLSWRIGSVGGGSGADTLILVTGNGTNLDTLLTTTSNSMTYGQTYFCAYTVNKTNGTCDIYVVDNTGSLVEYATTGTVRTDFETNVTNPYIGLNSDNSGDWGDALDEIQFYNKELSLSEVTYLSNNIGNTINDMP